MRQIKFRGKGIDDGKWVYGDLINLDLHTCITGESMWATLPTGGALTLEVAVVIPETVGQYWETANNQELYDGDIFSMSLGNVSHIMVVQYRIDKAMFCIGHPYELTLKHISQWQSPDERWWKEFGDRITVIGNIFDNPELINEL